MRSKEWTRRLAAIALVTAILIVLNPEIRAYLFFIEALGIDVFILLFVTQIRLLYAPLRAGTELMADLVCGAALEACRVITLTTLTFLSLRSIGILVCPMLLLIPLTSRCPAQ